MHIYNGIISMQLVIIFVLLLSACDDVDNP
jgi:hypothetical protein